MQSQYNLSATNLSNQLLMKAVVNIWVRNLDVWEGGGGRVALNKATVISNTWSI